MKELGIFGLFILVAYFVWIYVVAKESIVLYFGYRQLAKLVRKMDSKTQATEFTKLMCDLIKSIGEKHNKENAYMEQKK